MQRPDDREEVIGPRLHAYEKQTAPLAAYYGRLGLLHVIDAAKSWKKSASRCCKREECARGSIAGPGKFLGTGRWAIHLRSAEELEKMHRAGFSCTSFDRAAEAPSNGNHDDDLEKLAEEKIAGRRARQRSREYRGYPCVLCTGEQPRSFTGFHRQSASCAKANIVSLDFDGMDGYTGIRR